MTYQLLALLNAVVCASIMTTCVCRLALCHTGIAKLVRLKYTVLLGGSMAHGLQPFLFGEYPSVGGTCLAVSVLIGMLCSAARWRRHPPLETHTRTQVCVIE